MDLPIINGNVDIKKHGFYFACDSKYFDLYGIALSNSLKEFALWANIHVHIFNPTDIQITWCKENNVTCSYEYIDENLPEIKTYYACVRFIRIPEIFQKNTRIICLDADGIAIQPISEDIFLEYTERSMIFWREKQQKSLASSVFFGPDEFRYLYSNNLKKYFDSDTYSWYLDQNIMDEMIKNKEVEITKSHIWGWMKTKGGTLIWTGKGSKKFDPDFINKLNQFNTDGKK